MDWPLVNPEFDPDDLKQVLRYVPRKSYGISWYDGEEQMSTCELNKDRDICQFLNEIEEQKSNSGLAVMYGLRHLSLNGTRHGFANAIISLAARDAQGPNHNPAILQYVPFTLEAMSQIAAEMPLHGDTVRIINRSDMAFYEDIDLTESPHKATFYCCRTSGTWTGDLAISAVFYPETGFTGAVVFGCSNSVVNEIAGRIENSEDAWTHPMLIMGILAEIERERHLKLVQDLLFNLLQRVRSLSYAGTVSTTSMLTKEDYSIDLWIRVNQLRIQLRTWKKQLSKMQDHILELEKMLKEDPRYRKDEGRSWRHRAVETGRRAHKRLAEILSEYEEKVQECSMVIEGMTLSAQLVCLFYVEILTQWVLAFTYNLLPQSWNQIGYQDTQANLRIAGATRQDSNQMRTIAFLTMIFLPGTFLASIFSMTFFNWSASDGETVVSPYIGIYFGAVFVITLLVVGLWVAYTRPFGGALSKIPKQSQNAGFLANLFCVIWS
ncbi:hypothetical protein QBC42DRAFT_337177 [Cladorrhinum samala]|uniref:Uncharacterized protein n=1 Tax=Cladorrhinum samala TaxID=585594 RepID=A0AAV9HVM9_9PEZI|nr:hypothetical protein QBC42DRAFT_337177 [Cladorrhinum samala]